MPKKYKIEGQEIQRRASPNLSLIDEKARKIPFILISKENEGERVDWWTGDTYIERLDVSGASWDRLTTFFKDHNRSVDSAIGRVENIRVENGELKADVVFGSTPDAVAVFEKYRDGILTDVSIGYKVNTVTIEERKNEPDVVTVTDFEIRELSAVGIGFDKGATIGRNIEGGQMTPEQLEKLRELEALKERSEEQERELADLKAMAKQEEDKARKLEEENKELKRKAEIQELAIAYGASADVLDRFLQDKTKTKEDFLRHLLDEKTKQQPRVFAGRHADETHGEMIRAMSDGLLLRLGFSSDNIHQDADMFRGMSVQNMVRKIAGLPLEASESDLVRAMTTSDFPKLLANVQNKVIQDTFASAPVTFKSWTQAVDFKDFKPRTEVRKGSFSADFKEVHELGQTTYKEKGETGLTWSIKSYGARFAFSRQLLINDDLGVFVDDLRDMVEQVAVFQNRHVYNLLERINEYKDYVMEDGKPVFDASHKNYDETGASLSIDTLSAARTKMMRQKDFDGKQLRIIPKHLIIPPELEVTARQLLNSTADISAQNAGVVNPVKGLYNIITDMELTDTKAWYLAASKKTIKVGYLQGTGRRPIVEEVNRSNINGIEYELVFDFGLVVEDYRGLYKNNG